LSAYFDSNSDGFFDKSDDAWSSFGVWQDTTSNGIYEDGEFASLDAWGIESISLDYVPNNNAYLDSSGDVQVYGQIDVEYEDGSTGLAEDVAFTVPQATDATTSETDALIQGDDGTMPGSSDETPTEPITGSEETLTTADLVDQFLESNPVEDAIVAEIHQQDLINSENEAGMSDPDLTSETNATSVDAFEDVEEVHENDLDIEVEIVDIAMNDIVDTGNFDSGEDYSSGAV